VIGFVELFCRDRRHAPFNAGFIRTLHHAFPSERISIACADHHYRAILEHIPAAERVHLSVTSIDLPDRFDDAYHHVTLARFLAEFRLLRKLVSQSADVRLLVVSSLSSTGIFAARFLAASRSSRRVAVHSILHDNAGVIDGWRTRNPLLRWLDMQSALRRASGPRLRFIVLEDPIRGRLEERLPALRGRIDVVRQAIDPNESGGETIAELPELRSPVKIGFLGMATRAKGYDAFLRIASEFGRAHPGAAEFHGVGMLHSEFEGADQSALSVPMTPMGLNRAAYAAAVSRLHYACLPYSGSYYRFIASGVLVDAIAWCKPIIAIEQPVLTEARTRFGDVGYLCRDEAEVRSVIRDIALRPDPRRYAAQLEAMSRWRQTRLPSALGREYGRTVQRVFPGLFCD